MKSYSITDFKKDFPTEEACLGYIFAQKHPELAGKYYPIKGRKAFANAEGKQIHPVKGTIFEKSSTPLTLWFYAIFLFASSKNGVSAKELQRQLGVTYKCAWRMACQIRALMSQDKDLLTGTVEVDETYFGGRDKQALKFKNKTALMGMVERQGKIRVNQIENRETHTILNQVKKNISPEAHVMSDEFRVYTKLPKLGYQRSGIKHGKKHWVRGEVHTNTIEGFWGQLKRSIRGTYHSVSKQHLQSYVNEFAFRYNHRSSPVFQTLLGKI